MLYDFASVFCLIAKINSCFIDSSALFQILLTFPIQHNGFSDFSFSVMPSRSSFAQPTEKTLPLLARFVGKVIVQLVTYQQFGIEYLTALFMIPQVSLSPYSVTPCLLFWQFQAGKIVIALQFIPKSVFLVINVLSVL